MKILAQHVNDPSSFIYYRLCSRLDLLYDHNGTHVARAIEHFPLRQARRIINDVEAFLIYRCKPEYNVKYKNREKEYWKDFSVIRTVNIRIPEDAS